MTEGARAKSKRVTLWTAIGIVLIAANLRPAIVAVSPLLAQIRADLGLNGALAGLLTTLPVLCFGILSPLAPWASRRLGIERVLFLSMTFLCVGIGIRLLPGVVPLFAGTILLGAAIAFGNVLLPGLIKRDFAGRIGLMTGLYTMALSGGASLSAGITIPIQRAANLDWRYGLAMWGLLVLVGMIAWLPQLKKRHGGSSRIRHIPLNLWHSKLAWYITGFVGLQSFNYYAITAWLPAFFIDGGSDPATAGWMLSLANMVGLVASLVSGIVAGQMKRQRALGVTIAALVGVGVLGLIVAPGAAYLWVVMIGISQGSAITLVLTLMALRSPDAAHAAELSGMSQGVGYVVASAGPIAVGALHDLTLSWTPALLLVVLSAVPQALCAWGAGKDTHVMSR